MTVCSAETKKLARLHYLSAGLYLGGVIKRKNNQPICYYLWLLIGITFLLAGCGTTKSFVINSEPEGALVIKHYYENINEFPYYTKYLNETPTKGKVWFLGSESEYFTAEKRGYKASTQSVTKNSPEAILFRLEKINGVSEKVLSREELKTRKFILLPPEVEIIYHGGVGGFDKYKYSLKVSKEVTSEFNRLLTESCNKNSQIKPIILSEPLEDNWNSLSEDFKKQLKTLNPQRLKYYSTPPYIAPSVKIFEEFSNSIINQDRESLLLYIYGKCVTPSKGRIFGNIALSTASGVVQGFHASQGRSYYSNPNAFRLDSSTLIVLCVIDPHSSEVLNIDSILFNIDISKPNTLPGIVQSINQYPNIELKT